MTISDIVTRLLEEDGYLVTFQAVSTPGLQVAVLTDKGARADEHPEEMDRLVAQAHVQVLYKLGEPVALIAGRLKGQDIDPAELEPYFDSAIERGLVTRGTSGEYALTSSGEAAVAAYDAQHPTLARRLRAVPSEEGIPMAGKMEGDHGSHGSHSAHQKGTGPALIVVPCS
jgi:hypothetical protein